MVMRGYMEVKARGKSANTTAGRHALALGKRRLADQSSACSMWVAIFQQESHFLQPMLKNIVIVDHVLIVSLLAAGVQHRG